MTAADNHGCWASPGSTGARALRHQSFRRREGLRLGLEPPHADQRLHVLATEEDRAAAADQPLGPTDSSNKKDLTRTAEPLFAARRQQADSAAHNRERRCSGRRV